MIRAFLKTRIGIALSIAIVFIIGAIILKITLAPEKPSELRQKIGTIADTSVKNSLKDGSYGFEDALNLLSSTSIATGYVENGSTTPPTKTPVTATDLFARELFSKYAEAKKNGQPIDEVTQNDIANLVLSNDYSGQRKLVMEADLKTSEETGPISVRSYGNSLGKILTVKPVSGDQELTILERIRENGLSKADADTLNLIIKRYKGISDKLMEMEVPKDAASAHAALVNGVNLLADGVEGMVTLYTDPVGALTKIKYYENGINLVSAGSLRIKVYFMSKNIVFSSAENGYKITQ